MMGGYNMAAKKKERMGKMAGGKVSGSQPSYGGTIADAMPKGAPC